MKNLIVLTGLIFSILLAASCRSGKSLTTIAQKKLVKDSIIQTGHIGYCVYDLSEHKMLTAYDAEKLFIPASNTKLFTLYAGMKYIKDSINGIFYKYSNDTLIVLPTGDPTLLSNDFTTHPVLDFFKKNKKPFVLLEPATPLNPYGKGWAWDDQQEAYMTQRSIMPVYGNNIKMEWKKNNDIPQNQFTYELTTLNMRPPGFMMETKLDTSLIENKIERKPNSNAYTLTANNKSKLLEFSVPIETFGLGAAINILQSVSTPKAITQKNTYPNRDGFTAILSQPSDSLFRIMMQRSDNFYAEQILLMAGDELNTGFDEEKTITTLLTTDLKDIPQKPRWVDGSGLSRYNLFSPKDMVYIMEKLINEFGIERVTNILPTGGAGTLKNMFLADKGFIFAKTGSMGNTYCLSGLLKSAKGKTLLFSVMTNNFSGKTADVKRPIEQFLHNIRMNY